MACILNDRVQAHPTRARLPAWSSAVLAQTREFLPGLRAVCRTKQRGVFHTGVYRIRIGQRWLQMPHSLELPRMRLSVVPLVSAGDTVVNELVAQRLPSFAAVVRALDQLPKPSARLRQIQPVGIDRRPLQVINLPARKMRT